MSTDALVSIRCGKCGVSFGMSQFMYDQRKADGETFYCTNGHPRAYHDTEADKLRRERDQLRQRLAHREDVIQQKNDHIAQTEKRLAATRGVVTRIKNRVGAGVCPCCTRTFGNLQAHMKTQHPAFRVEAAE